MRILLTGASGFLGRHVTRLLAEHNHTVLALLRNVDPTGDMATPKVEQLVGDLDDQDAIGRIIQENAPEAVVHLAWYTDPQSYKTSPRNLDSLIQTVALMKAAAGSGCRRFLGAGTCAEYDWSCSIHREDQTPCLPATLYGACKHAAFLTGQALFTGMNTSFVWPRFNFLFGPDDRPQRLVAAAIDSFRAGTDFLCAHPEKVRDFLHVEEAASATVAILESTVAGPVNVGSGEPIDIGSLVDRLAELVGGPGRRRQAPDISPATIEMHLTPELLRLTTEVGWKPERDVDSSLVQTVTARDTGRGVHHAEFT